MNPTLPTPIRQPSSMARIWNFLDYARSLLFTDLLIYLYTAVCGTFSICGSFFDAHGRWQHGCARAWSWLILKTSRIRLSIEGIANFDPNQTVIFCSNHPSAMDIPILFVSLPVQFRFLAKRGLFSVPFLGWHLRRSGHIPVDRGRPREALKGFDQAAQRIKEGRPVVVFPEGSRSRTCEMLPFKSGTFYLAILSGVPIVPITVNGSREVLAPDSLHIRPGRVRVVIHKAISTAGLSVHDVSELSNHVRDVIVSGLDQKQRP
ncbi:MAG TPA: lysophospholipid acyltransferase family protein [Terriglobia bacterium]|nr:lysophospholipid acyltransferase family protein [Terriglobia bacterium]